MNTYNPSNHVSTFILELAALIFIIITAPIWIPIVLLLFAGGVVIIGGLIAVGVLIYIAVVNDINPLALIAIVVVGLIILSSLKDSSASK